MEYNKEMDNCPGTISTNYYDKKSDISQREITSEQRKPVLPFLITVYFREKTNNKHTIILICDWIQE